MNLIRRIFKRKKFEECVIKENCIYVIDKKICKSGKEPFISCERYKKNVEASITAYNDYFKIFYGIDLIDFNPN